jgi:hypothetical protein
LSMNRKVKKQSSEDKYLSHNFSVYNNKEKSELSL